MPRSKKMAPDEKVAAYHLAAKARQDEELLAMIAAQPRRAGPPRGERVPIDIYEAGERVTLIDHTTYATPLRAIKTLSRAAMETGIVYGAICEELEGSGVRGIDLGSVSGGGGGPEGAVDRRLRIRAMRDEAHAVLALIEPIRPMRRSARPGQGEAQLGKARRVRLASGGEMMPRREITARVLVDSLCIANTSVCDVLVKHGWGTGGTTKASMVGMLSAALDEIAAAWGGGVTTGSVRGIRAIRPGTTALSAQAIPGRERVLDGSGSLVLRPKAKKVS